MTTSMTQRCSAKLDPNFEVPGNLLGITLQSDDNHGLSLNAETTGNFSLRVSQFAAGYEQLTVARLLGWTVRLNDIFF